MKISTLTTILTIFFRNPIFYWGNFYGKFFEWTLPNIDGMKFRVASLGGRFNGMLTFALTLTLIPISSYFNWKLAPIIMTKRKVLNILILLACIILFTIVKREWLMFQSNRYLKELSQDFDNKFRFQIPIENFNVTNYMLLGLLIGTAISYFSLRQKIIS